MSMNMYTTKEIKPCGWLKRQLEIQAEGLSGNLDKVWPDIRDSAWIGGNREGWERVPYWLDGFIPLSYLLENEDMIARCKKYIDAIISAQQDDGWICPCKKDERSGYDTWAIQLITKVLKVYYDCSADERIPSVIYKVLKNYYELLKSGEIKLFDWGKYRWFEGYIAIDFIYEKYGESWILELADILKTQGIDYGTLTEKWKRPLFRWHFERHIVNLAMMLKHEALECKLFKTPYSDKAELYRTILDEYNGTPFESFTGDECLAGISPSHGTELCAIVEQMYSYELLYAYTGDSKWAEKLEVLAFNALPATISDDMWTHQYDQMSNQISCEKFMCKSYFGSNGPEAHLFGLEPNYGCCTANFNQGWPKFALSAFMYDESAITNTVMIPSKLETENATIELQTNYPFENSAKYTVNATNPFKFKIRIPSFAKNLIVNGRNAENSGHLEFDIKAGQTEISVSFETLPRFKERPNSLYAVQCGSLLFSVPIEYEKKMHEYEIDGVERKFPYCDYELIPKSEWSYGYCNTALKRHFRGISSVPFSSSEPPVTLDAQVKKINWGYAHGYENVCAEIPASVEPLSESINIKLYPYGCAKLRMTELPFVK